MKTIFIPIFQGVEAKNILRTDIFSKLTEKNDLRIVLFLNNPLKIDYYQQEFNNPNLIYEVVEHYRPTSLHWIATFLKFNLLRCETMDIRRRMELEKDKNYLKFWLKFIFNRLFARKYFRRLVRWLDYHLVKDDNFVEHFKKYKPDLILLAHLFGDTEISMLRQAKKRKVKSVGLINSWDKLTCRCILRLLPDKMIVHNQINKEEARQLNNMPEKDIVVVGVPHFDYYITDQVSSREEFCQRLGIGPKKRIILYSPLGKYYNEADWAMVELLDEFLNKKMIPEDVHFLVRYPPKERVESVNLKLENIKKDNFTFDRPGKTFAQRSGKKMRFEDLTDWDLDFQDLKHMLDTMYHVSLVICYASSVGIDAAIFDKPVINLNFEIKREGVPPVNNRWIYQLTHYQNLLKCQGIRMANNEKELIEWINKYLTHPEIDKEGRQRILKQQCWPLDGKAGQRTANFLLDLLK